MVVDVEVWAWSKTGMIRTLGVGFIRKEEVERLLEEAHERGRQHGLRQATEITHRSFNDA